MDEKQILDMAENYRQAMIREQNDLLAASNARAAVDFETARILGWSYVDGQIDGKNEAARKIQDAGIIDNSNSLYWLKKYQAEKDLTAALTTVDRKAMETWIGLVKAWLYSQSKAG